jgi:signal transduction histidine kinase
LLHAELLQSKLARFPNDPLMSDLPMLRSVADCIVSDTQRSADIIRKLRNLFRLSKGEKADMRVDQLVLDVASLLHVQLQASEILLTTDFSTELRFFGDATQLQQVVLNLFNNAMDALNEKRPLYPQLKIWGLEQEGFLVLHVQENGKGIPVELQDEIFSLFKTSKSQGMGVGLWLSRAIVESHGGQLNFKSDPGWGTVFTMRLPSTSVHRAS